MGKTQYESRLNDLKDRINRHLSKLTGQEKDFFSILDQSDLVELKTVLADINNLLTFKMTIAAAKWLAEYIELDAFGK